MDNELVFRINLGTIFFLLSSIRLYYTVAAVKSGSSFSVSRVGSLRALFALFLYVFILLSAFVYILAPSWLAWAALPLPPALRWFGVGIGIGSVFLLFWVHRTLGRNFAAPGIIQARQTLIISGPYHWVRHPMYTTFFTISATVALVAANWIIIIMCLLFGILLPSVIQTEEQTLLEKFGDEYREYMQRTGRFLPRLRM
jgi:protein-S-isoprenylcysteine O-methyltransferase Ste14